MVRLGFRVDDVGLGQRKVVINRGELVDGELSQHHETMQGRRHLPRTIEAVHHVTTMGTSLEKKT